jgi:UDP-N-acetylglucosamine transferase subunit ALG13
VNARTIEKLRPSWRTKADQKEKERIMIRQIEKEELRTMHGREGLVLQGCGGDLKEWIGQIKTFGFDKKSKLQKNPNFYS